MCMCVCACVVSDERYCELVGVLPAVCGPHALTHAVTLTSKTESSAGEAAQKPARESSKSASYHENVFFVVVVFDKDR